MASEYQDGLSAREFYRMVIEAQQPWGVSRSDIFDASLKDHMRIFPDLPQRLAKFIQVKLENPLTARFGKHDGPMTAVLTGFHHCHLKDDAILIYNLKNRCVNLVMIVSHAEIDKPAATQRLMKKISHNLQRK